MVFEATYLVTVLTAGQISLCCGQYGAQMSKVFRPSNKSNGMLICFFMAAPLTGSECGLVHPPYAKSPLVSSVGPPGPCMTPSRDINSSTLIFLMTEFLPSQMLTVCFRLPSARAVFSFSAQPKYRICCDAAFRQTSS